LRVEAAAKKQKGSRSDSWNHRA